ncbi:MAG: GNAT family N-acetyltransferase [Opitutaceae bacterium]|nr:GNAT family N-acetyltransferase [Opitutaceae bacterium]
MHKPPATFVTARLAARPPSADDAPAVFAAYASDAEVTRYLAWPPYTRVEPLAGFLRDCAANWENSSGHFVWLLSLKGTTAPIGTIGLKLEPGGKTMFGYALAKRCWGHGFAAEALKHLVDWSLAQPGIFRAYAYCDVENPASARVMEKAGMVREGILRRWHVAPTIGPEPRDCLVCARVR